MKISEIIYGKNNSKLEDLIPVKSIQTEEDLNNSFDIEPSIVTRSDNTEFTIIKSEKEFFERYESLFEGVNRDNIYYNKNSLMNMNAVIYLDLEHLILADLSDYIMYFESKIDSDDNYCSISNLIKRLEDDYRNKEYSSLFFHMPDAFRLEVLNKFIGSKDIKIDDDIYKMFMGYYVSTDFGFDFIDRETVEKLLNSKSDKLKAETEKKLSNLPDKIVVYRGEADKSTDYKNAYSWSTNPSIALLFSLKYLEERGRIITGVVSKKDIIECLNQRDEDEVLILPGNVQKVKVYDFYSLDSVQKRTDDILDIFGDYKYALNNELEFEHDSDEHGKLHSLRVLLNSLTLGKIKGLDEEDLNILAMASVYHDIARINDEIDDLHGEKACEIFKDTVYEIFGYGEYGTYYEENNDIVEFLIKYHCIDDDLAMKALSESEITDKVKAKKLFSIFKDADALDRLRFGVKGLDFTYLRNKEAIKLIMFSNFAVRYIEL